MTVLNFGHHGFLPLAFSALLQLVILTFFSMTGAFTHPMQDSYNQTTLIEIRSCRRRISSLLDCSWSPIGVGSPCLQESHFWLECQGT